MVKPEQLNLLENRREIRHFVHKKAVVPSGVIIISCVLQMLVQVWRAY